MHILGMGRDSIFPHWLIMGRYHLNDLTSGHQYKKIWEIQVLVTYRNLKVWRYSEEHFGFHTTSNFINRICKVGSHDLFRWANLEYLFLPKCAQWMWRQSASFSSMAPGVWRWDGKNLKGGIWSRPLPGIGLIGLLRWQKGSWSHKWG